MPLRDYQLDALSAISLCYHRGVRRQLVVMPTGCGKTRVAAEVPGIDDLKEKRLLFLVHRDELAQQAAAAFSERWPGLKVGIEKASQQAGDARIVIGSVQSLKGKRLAAFEPHEFGSVIIDEAHHAPARIYRQVLEHFQVLKDSPDNDPNKLLVGITATPKRADNIGLDSIFDEISYPENADRDIRWYIQRGWLVDIVGIRVETQADIREVGSRCGDFIASQLERQVNTEYRNNLVVEQYSKISFGGLHQGLAFTVDVQHTYDLHEQFRQCGVRSYPLTGKTKISERRRVIDDYRQGRLDVLVSCAVLTEGTDLPSASIALMACPTRSGLKYRQCVGRVMRPCPSPEEVQAKGGAPLRWRKLRCWVVDFVDVSRHQLYTAPTLVGLHPELKTAGKSLAEAADEVERLQKAYQVDLMDIRDLADVSVVVNQISVLEPPHTPSEIARLSSYAWLRDPEGYRLATLEGKVLALTEDTLGRWHVIEVERGIRRTVAMERSLKKAVAVADSLVPASDQRVLRQRARWRKMKPTEKQLRYLWSLDPRIRRGHGHNYDSFEEDMLSRCSRGDISAMIDRAKNLFQETTQ